MTKKYKNLYCQKKGKANIKAIGGLVVIIVIVAVIFSFSVTKEKSLSSEIVSLSTGEVTLYKSMNCGCCGVYGNYIGKKGLPVLIENMEDMSLIKKEVGIPSNMESCHTMKVGDYFVEGHIPLEAIEKLVSEKPEIKGIAMPGMPSGSPGMPGTKRGNFVIYAVNNDGSTSEFMRI